MSVANVLDRVALLCAGPQAGEGGHYAGAGGITGVLEAWSRAPTSVQPFTAVAFPPIDLTLDYVETSSGLRVADYIVTVRLFITLWGPELQQVIADALPFIERFMDRFEQHVKLTDLTNADPQCSVAVLERIRFERGHYSSVDWLVLAFDLRVIEKTAVTLAV